MTCAYGDISYYRDRGKEAKEVRRHLHLRCMGHDDVVMAGIGMKRMKDKAGRRTVAHNFQEWENWREDKRYGALEVTTTYTM